MLRYGPYRTAATGARGAYGAPPWLAVSRPAVRSKTGPQGAQLRPMHANIGPLSFPVPPVAALLRKCFVTARTVPRSPGRAALTARRRGRKWRPRRRPAPRRPNTPHRPKTRPRDVHLGPLSPLVSPGSVLVRIYVVTGRIRPVHRKTPKVRADLPSNAQVDLFSFFREVHPGSEMGGQNRKTCDVA